MPDIERLFGLAPETVLDVQRRYTEKAARNRANGLKAYRTGEVKPFQGYNPEPFKGLYNYVLLLDPSSRQAVAERVIDPVQKIAEKHGIPTIFAGQDDLPPHITLQTGNFRNVTPDEQMSQEGYLGSNSSHLKWLGRIMSGRSAYINNIVLAGSVFYADSQGFMQENSPLYRARQLLKWKFTGERNAESTNYTAQQGQAKQAGLIPVDYDDITHISVGRLTGVASPESLTAFAAEVYGTVEPELQRDPLKVTVADVYQGSAYDFFMQNAPHLIKQPAE